MAWRLHYSKVTIDNKTAQWRCTKKFYLFVCVFSVFLGNIKLAFERNPDLKSLLLDDFFRQAVGNCQESWRDVIATAAKYGVPVPAFSTALSFYDAYRCQRLPANLIQVNIQLKVGFIEKNIP